MMLYILKSSLCLLLLFGFYKLLLESEKLHWFNRFYLLFSLVFSFAIPVLTVPIQPKFMPSFDHQPILQAESHLTDRLEPDKPLIQAAYDFSGILEFLYWLVTSALFIRFLRNGFSLIRRISQRRKIDYQGATLVLLPENCLPHTFLQYLFVSQSAYESGAIEPELFTHELAHIRQRHSVDILFIELVSCFCWFNPLLPFVGRAIRLNHEFLADSAVIDQHQLVVEYQRLLLSKLALATPVYLTSQLTFQATKQRFLMMTKRTSRTRVLLTGAVAISLFALLAVVFSIQSVAQTPALTPQKAQRRQAEIPPTDIEKFEEQYKDKLVIITPRDRRKFSNLSEAEKKNVVLIRPMGPKTPTEAQFSDWKNPKLFGIWLDGKKVNNKVLDSYKPTDIASFSGSFVHKNARQPEGYLYQMDLMTHSAYERYLKEKEERPFLVMMQPRPKRP